MRLFGGVEESYVDIPPVCCLQLRSEASASVHIARHSKKPCGVVPMGSTLVLTIDGPRRIAQVGQSVVERVAVDVIDQPRPRGMDVEPCEPMRQVVAPKHPNPLSPTHNDARNG